ncbi:phosphate signaling complex PhoU family protein [Cetobacterium sp. SF1]|uniref:phosphate signaling complex PhoU family protein n=1 Tax=unclassified Cetobacterium TaxID=2630983 RepID=UPI003CF47483
MRNLNESLEALEHHYLEMLKYVNRNFHTNLAMLEAGEFNGTLYGEAKIVEDSLNAFDVKIKEDCIITIARFQPAAKNLRKLVMLINSVRLLERMGDLLKGNLFIIRDIDNKAPHLKEYLSSIIYPLGKKINELLDLYIEAYMNSDTKILYDILYLDEGIDEIVSDNFNKFIEIMKASPENAEGGAFLILLDKKFERLSDHIIHLVTDLIYILNGENMRKIELLSKN